MLWEMVSDDAGQFLTLYSLDQQGNAVLKEVDEVMKVQAWKDEEGDILFRKFDPQTMAYGSCFSVEPELIRHKAASCQLPLGTYSSAKMRVFAFARPGKAQQRLYWAASSIHSFIGIKLYDGKLSKWWGCGVAAWQTA
eukprot:8431350-Lingulodinium_polyedra.AAC.1